MTIFASSFIRSTLGEDADAVAEYFNHEYGTSLPAPMPAYAVQLVREHAPLADQLVDLLNAHAEPEAIRAYAESIGYRGLRRAMSERAFEWR